MLYDFLFGNAKARVTRKRPRKGALRQRRFRVEPLEDRRMLSGVSVTGLSLLAKPIHSATVHAAADPTPSPTTATWTSTNGSSVYGQKITLAVDVTTTGTGPVTGFVNFYNGTTKLGRAPVLATGEADLTTGKLPVGVDSSITATFVANAKFATSTTTDLTETVAAASTTTVLYAFPNPTGYGQMTLLTAMVSAVSPSSATPAGTVAFDLVTGPSGSPTLTSLGTSKVGFSGLATLATDALPLSPTAGDVIEAVYNIPSTNSNVIGSTSKTVTVIVNQAQPQVSVSLPSTTTRPITSGESLTFTATVSAGGLGYAFPLMYPGGNAFPLVSPGICVLLPWGGGTPATGLPDPAAPTGSVEFLDGTTVLATVPLTTVSTSTSSTATYTTSSLIVGLHAISVVYLPGTDRII